MPTYNIQPNSVSPGGEEQKMSCQQIMPILHGLAPGDVASAGAAFEELGKTLDAVAGKLRDTAMKLAADDSWRGAAAQAAMNRFQQLHDQAAQLAANAHTTANSVNWIGQEVLPKFKSIPAPQVMGAAQADAAAGGAVGSVLMPGGGEVLGAGAGYVAGALGFGPDGQAKADSAARQYLAALNGHLASAPFPQSITSADQGNSGIAGQHWITPGSHGGGGSGIGGGSGTGGGMGGAGGSGGGPMPSYSPPPGAGHFNPAKLPNTPSASLQGYAPPAASHTGSPFGPGSPGGVNVNGGGSANPFSRMPTTMPVGGFGKGGLPRTPGIPRENGIAADSAAGKAGASATDGAAGEAAAADAAGARAAGAGGAEGAGMMPMTGAGSGQQDKERQRQAWMHEDDDIWGLPRDSMGPIID